MEGRVILAMRSRNLFLFLFLNLCHVPGRNQRIWDSGNPTRFPDTPRELLRGCMWKDVILAMGTRILFLNLPIYLTPENSGTR